MRCGIYTRVSTDEQGRPGHTSLETQLADSRDLAQQLGCIVVLEESDTQSGLDARRPGYQRILTAARAGEIDTVIAWRLDRWGRDAGEAIVSFGNLQRLGVAIHFVMEPEQDPFMRGLKALLGEQSSRDTSQRVLRARRAMAQNGNWGGKAPLGYRITPHLTNEPARLEPDPDTAPLVRRLFEAYAQGDASLGSITNLARAIGLRSTRGYLISRPAIGQMLHNPVYKGAMAYGRTTRSKFSKYQRFDPSAWTVIEGVFPAIVSPELWERVQSQLKKNHHDQGTIRRTKHLLTSFIFCGRCANVPGNDGRARLWPMYGTWTGKEPRRPYYRCSRAQTYHACDMPIIRADELERTVKAAIIDGFQLVTGARVALAEQYVRDELDERRSAAMKQRASMERTLSQHHETRMALAVNHAKGIIPDDVYRDCEARELEAVHFIERELAALPLDATANIDPAPLLQLLGAVSWDDLEWDDWRELLPAFIVRIKPQDARTADIEWTEEASVLRRALVRVS